MATARDGVTFSSPLFEHCDKDGTVRNRTSLHLDFVGAKEILIDLRLRCPVSFEDFTMVPCKILRVAAEE